MKRIKLSKNKKQDLKVQQIFIQNNFKGEIICVSFGLSNARIFIDDWNEKIETLETDPGSAIRAAFYNLISSSKKLYASNISQVLPSDFYISMGDKMEDFMRAEKSGKWFVCDCCGKCDQVFMKVVK